MKRSSMKCVFKYAIVKQRVAAAAIALMVVASLSLGVIIPVKADTKSKTATSKLTEDQKVVHLLNRLGFGPRPGDVERVKRIGIDKYIDQQLRPERIDDSAVQARLRELPSLNMPIAEIYEKYPAPNFVARELGLRPAKANQQVKTGEPANAQPSDAESKEDEREMRRKIFAYYAEHGLKPPQTLLQELQAQKIIRAVYSERHLQEVMTDFWFNHFNVFWGKGADKWLTTDFEMNAIRPHTMGKFKDLLLATAKSPAMLFYLDNFQSMSPDAKLPGQGERPRRGLFRKNQGLLDGDSGNKKAEKRRQQVQDSDQMTSDEKRRLKAANQLRNRKRGINENYAREIMELHTLGVDGGYTQKDVQEVARCFTGWTIEQPRVNGRFIFREWMHDNGEKVVLGQKIPAGGGIKDGEIVIDILSRHPNTAKFISTKLVRRFVSDNPPQSLVDRVAAVYRKTDGDIREALRTIFTSQEFYSTDAYRAKIKSPFDLAVSAIRALGVDLGAAQQTAQFISKMGQPLYLYQPPTGFPDRAEQWVNTGALLERLNFSLALSSRRIRGTTVDLKKVAPEVSNADTRRVMERAIALLLNGDVSSETRAILDRQLKEGVPVKGELGDSSTSAMENSAMQYGDAMQDEDSLSAQPYEKGARKERLGGKRGRRLIENMVALPRAEAEVAKVFGLVLGSPEFQRR